MASVFQIADANPIRFTRADDPDLFTLNQTKCYFQKWNQSDSTKIQILTNLTSIDFLIRDYATNLEIGSIPVIEIPINIIHPDYTDLKCFEVSIPFGSLLGQYFAEISYSGISDPPVTLYSEPFEVAESHPDTLLYKYKNSENNFSIIFDTNIEFDFRSEGTIKEFTPSSDDVIYNDQKINSTLLYSIPWRQFKLYATGVEGSPDWLTDKINRIMSMDQKSIDGDYYEKIDGAKWEVIFEVEYPFSGLSIAIMPVENVFLQRIKTGDQPPEGYTIVEKVKNYFANAANILVEIFVKYSLWKHISIINYGGAITLKLGLTNGGSEIAEFAVPAGSVDGEPWTGTIDYLFKEPTDVYITGLTGSNADILLDYLQYNEATAQPIPAPAANLGIGSVIRFEEIVPGDLNAAFDLGTGLGKVGTDWLGWALKDGRNGTVDEGGRVAVQWVNDPISPYYVLGTLAGEVDHVLIQDELPTFDIPFNYDGINRNGSGSQETMRNYPGVNRAANIPFPGGDLGHNNMQPYIVALWVKKIA